MSLYIPVMPNEAAVPELRVIETIHAVFQAFENSSPSSHIIAPTLLGDDLIGYIRSEGATNASIASAVTRMLYDYGFATASVLYPHFSRKGSLPEYLFSHRFVQQSWQAECSPGGESNDAGRDWFYAKVETPEGIRLARLPEDLPYVDVFENLVGPIRLENLSLMLTPLGLAYWQSNGATATSTWEILEFLRMAVKLASRSLDDPVDSDEGAKSEECEFAWPEPRPNSKDERNIQFWEWSYRDEMTPAQIRDLWNRDNPRSQIRDGHHGVDSVKKSIKSIDNLIAKRGLDPSAFLGKTK